jgi:hypothetical protein
MTGRDVRSVPDLDTAAWLGNGYMLAWCIAGDGEAWPWLVRNLCGECDAAATHGSRDLVPAHERTGRLPAAVRDALGLVHRCGAPTRRGEPCRARVSEAGELCGAHRTYPSVVA